MSSVTRKQRTLFFSEMRVCADCGIVLTNDYPRELCPSCEDQKLFKQVRAFIRENDVTEDDVCNEFGLPKRIVRNWIRAGRIEYVETESRQFAHFEDPKSAPQLSGFMSPESTDSSRWRATDY